MVTGLSPVVDRFFIILSTLPTGSGKIPAGIISSETIRWGVQETVLIAGCSGRIGRATAQQFNEAGWTVYATARNPSDIETLGETGCEIATLDVTDQSDIDRVIDRILDEEGAIGCLVNNAGYGQVGTIEEISTETIQTQFDVNVFGPHRLMRAVLPHMRRENDGTIINISSIVGRVAVPGAGAYSGSKFALEAMSDAVRNEVDKFGIDVAVIEPGPVQTGAIERVTTEPEEIDRDGPYERLYSVIDNATAVGRDGPGSIPPERVAEDVLDAASSTKPAARYPTGTPAQIGVFARFLPARVRDALFDAVEKLGG